MPVPPAPTKKSLDHFHFHSPIAVLAGDKGPSSPVFKGINPGKQLTAIYLRKGICDQVQGQKCAGSV